MAWLTTAERFTDESGLRATQAAFLERLADCGSITDAASSIGLNRRTHYDWMAAEALQGIDTSEDGAPEGTYSHAFARAKKMGADRIRERSEAHALSDATDMPAVVNRIFQIKRYFPEYRDQLNVKHSGAVLQARVDLNQLDHTERAELLRLTQRRLLLLQNDVAPGDGDPVDGGD